MKSINFYLMYFLIKPLGGGGGFPPTIFEISVRFYIAAKVGYAQQTANATRNTMMTPNFLNANSATGCKLSDLTVTGYDAPVWNEEDECYDNGCQGADFVLQFLNNNGSIAAQYYWLDNGEIPAGWYLAGQTPIEGGAESVNIPAGTAAWVIGTGKKLQVAGQVNMFDVAKKMNATRNTAVGNCMPVDLKLSQLTVTGYDAPTWNEEDECYDNGCQGADFVLQFLNNNGSIAAQYYWLDNGEIPAGWYLAGQTPIEGGAGSVNIPAGKGAWVIGSGKTLNIPAPEL